MVYGHEHVTSKRAYSLDRKGAAGAFACSKNGMATSMTVCMAFSHLREAVKTITPHQDLCISLPKNGKRNTPPARASEILPNPLLLILESLITTLPRTPIKRGRRGLSDHNVVENLTHSSQDRQHCCTLLREEAILEEQGKCERTNNNIPGLYTTSS